MSDSGSLTAVLKDITGRALMAVASQTWVNTDPSQALGEAANKSSLCLKQSLCPCAETQPGILG